MRGHARPIAIAGVLALGVILGLAGVPYLNALPLILIYLGVIRAVPPKLALIQPLEGIERSELVAQLRWILGYVIALILLAIPGSYLISLHPLLLFPDRVQSGLMSWQHVFASVVFGLLPAFYFVRRFRSTGRQLGLTGISGWGWIAPLILIGLDTVLTAMGVFGGHNGTVPPPSLIAAALAIALFGAAIPEELLFRALLQTRLEAVYGRWIGIISTAALFGLMHAPQTLFLSSAGKSGPVSVVIGVLLGQGVGGLIFGYVWTRYRNLWALVAMHAVGDFIGFVAIFGGYIPLN